MPLRDSYPESANLVLIVQCARCGRNNFFEFAVGEDVAGDCRDCGGVMKLVATIRMTRTDVGRDIFVRPQINIDRNTSRDLQSIIDIAHGGPPSEPE